MKKKQKAAKSGVELGEGCAEPISSFQQIDTTFAPKPLNQCQTVFCDRAKGIFTGFVAFSMWLPWCRAAGRVHFEDYGWDVVQDVVPV